MDWFIYSAFLLTLKHLFIQCYGEVHCPIIHTQASGASWGTISCLRISRSVSGSRPLLTSEPRAPLVTLVAGLNTLWPDDHYPCSVQLPLKQNIFGITAYTHLLCRTLCQNHKKSLMRYRRDIKDNHLGRVTKLFRRLSNSTAQRPTATKITGTRANSRNCQTS